MMKMLILAVLLVFAMTADSDDGCAPQSLPFGVTFDDGTQCFAYGDDKFYGTDEPNYASGQWKRNGAYDGGGLLVKLGGKTFSPIDGISGGWTIKFAVDELPGIWNVSFWLNLTQTNAYESDEFSRALLSVDGILYGVPPTDYLDQINGNGNGGKRETTGWQYYSIDVGPLELGIHTLTIGGYNNRFNKINESTVIIIDDVMMSWVD